MQVTFFIDANGILTVRATEKSSGENIETRIQNGMVELTDDDIYKLRKENEKFLSRNKINKIYNYRNLKETLKDFQDAINETEDDEERYIFLMNYNYILEEFIDRFKTDFDNEVMIETYYIYVKDLIISYSKILNIKSQIIKEDVETIIKNIKKYLEIFSKLSSSYIDDLLEIMKEKMPKKVFLEIVVNAMAQLNKCGKKCLEEKKKLCKYHSLLYFEKSNLYYKKYIGDTKELNICSRNIHDEFKEQVKNINL